MSMAGIAEYSNLKYNLEEDDVDNIDRFQQQYASSPYLAPHQSQPPRYQYVNSARDLTLPLQKHKNNQSVLYDSPEDDVSLRKYLGVSVGLVSLITENLLSHPFVVLRRQCQVHHNSRKYHLIPVTLIPVIVHLHQRQGVTTLWKGIGSVLLVRGMTMAVEDVITKFTPWPKEIHSHTTMKQFGQHIVLKCISIAAVLPFYSASLVETVQSDIASEKPGIFDVFREGAARLISWSAPQKGRMLPIWALVGPCVTLGLSKYLFGIIVKGVTTRLMCARLRHSQEQKGARPRDIVTQNQDIQVYSTLVSLITTEIIFYPFETVLHRLQLQGTRTIIDNLDTGYSVIPILTSYEGVLDCYKTTVATEGFAGLYKGFGSMVLQFAAHLAVIKLSKWIITQVTEICSTKPPPKVAEFYNLEPKNNSVNFTSTGGSTTISRSLSGVSLMSDDA